MIRTCHRCHAELPGHSSAGYSASDEDEALFCPRCGAPQLLLPEYMRSETAVEPSESTTGAVPPPRPQLVEWTVALRCALPVALATGVFAALAQVIPTTGFLTTLSVLAGAGVVLALYRARRPLARVNGRVGLRVGLVTGLLMVTAMGVALAGTGLVARYALHGMSAFDQDMQKSQQMSVQMMQQFGGLNPDPALRREQLALMASPEIRAGGSLFSLAMMATIILLLTTAAGGFAGILQTRRRGLPRGN